MEVTQPLGPPPAPQPKRKPTTVYILAGAIAILAIVLLVVLNRNSQLSTDKTELEGDRTDLQAELNELDKKMAEMDGALSDAKLDNQRKQEMIKKLDDEITYLKVRLQKSMAQGQLTARERDEYKGKYEQLEFYNRRYRQKIAELEALLKEQGEKIDRLTLEKDSLTTANTHLEDQNLLYELKIQVGSKLAASAITVYGVNSRGKEDAGPKLNRRRTRALKSCVTLEKNDIADMGTRSLYMVVLKPDGRILHHPSMGSGYYSTPGGEQPYSASARIEYKRARTQACATFTLPPDAEMDKGLHKVIWYTRVSENAKEVYELGRSEILIQ
ncbi:MAG: hypothetical protein KF690_02195 [Bacteroidetes bacterium]|nr:hypothetical protein [Bacteroidota bacterium]